MVEEFPGPHESHLNPFEEALQPITDDYLRLARKARGARVTKFGDVELSKREARSRLRQEWAMKTREERLAELVVPGRAGEILDLLGQEEL